MKKITKPTFFIPILLSTTYLVALLFSLLVCIAVYLGYIALSQQAIVLELGGYALIALSPIMMAFGLCFAIWHKQSVDKSHPRYRNLPLIFTCISQGIGIILLFIIVLRLLMQHYSLIM